MTSLTPSVYLLALLVAATPAALVVVLGVASLIELPLAEAATKRLIRMTILVALTGAVVVFAVMLATGNRSIAVEVGDWAALHAHEDGNAPSVYHFKVKLLYDRLSVPFLMLSLVLCGTIGAFAVKYLHREPGFNRFFVLYSLFVLGMVLTSLAGTIETLFAGWELVGLSSALLVSFFHERPAPVRNGLRVWIVYRLSDAALVIAAVLIHRVVGSGDFEQLLGRQPWPSSRMTLEPAEIGTIGLFLVLAAAGKSALVPFSGWLPRAMEGPTPSSAVFYGALSVHLGAFLLLRMSAFFEASPLLAAVLIALGLTTAVSAYLAGSVQTDIKSALSYASLAQVGLIVAEIGLGWHYIPLVHMIGHAFLRTLQFLRAPTLLQDYRHLENAIGARLPRGAGIGGRLAPAWQAWLFRFSLERGYFEAILTRYLLGPFVRLCRWLDRLESRCVEAIAQRQSGFAESDYPTALK